MTNRTKQELYTSSGFLFWICASMGLAWATTLWPTMEKLMTFMGCSLVVSVPLVYLWSYLPEHPVVHRWLYSAPDQPNRQPR